jgi:hypothetical protein
MTFREPVKDATNTVVALQEMLSRRTQAMADAHTAESKLKAAKTALADNEGQQGSQSKIHALERAVERWDVKSKQAAEEADVISERALKEAARFRLEKERDLKTVIREHMQSQAALAREMAQVWEDVLRETETTSLTSSASASAGGFVGEGFGDEDEGKDAGGDSEVTRGEGGSYRVSYEPDAS